MRFLLAAIMVFSTFQASSQDMSNEDFVINMTGMAGACGASEAQIRESAGYVAAHIRTNARYDPKQRTDAAVLEFINRKVAAFRDAAEQKGGKLFDKPCSFYRQMLDGFLESKGAWLKADTSATKSAKKKAAEPEDEDDEMSGRQLRKRLTAMANEIPTGQLAALAGCWKSTFQGWAAQLCLTGGGDKVTLELRNSAGVICRLDDGNARKRSDGAYVYAFAQSGKCTNGRAIQHFEGYCEGGARKLDCQISIYQERNNAFMANKTEPLGGKREFTRTN